MDENLCYSNSEDEDERRISSSQWHLDHDSLMSLERESSRLFLKYRNYHLYLIQRKEPPSLRLIIPASKSERLCYYRNYVSSPNKIQIACLHQKHFNTLFWKYILYSLHKSLQHTFVNIFLASYVPEEHLFASKMVPLMHGLKFSFVITGFLEVLLTSARLVLLLDYVIGSIFLKNPWNKCPSSGKYVYEDNNITVNCFTIPDFAKRVHNKTVVIINHFYYIVEDFEYLQLVQIEYFKYRIATISGAVLLIYICLMWGLICLCYNQIFKKNFWKTYNIVHWCVMSIDIVSFVYLVISYFNEEIYEPHIHNIYHTELTQALTIADIDFVAESTTAPPVIHVLTARSTQEILPGRDSAVIVLSNAICFLFRALLSYRVRQHCESLTRVPLISPEIAYFAWLYFWPMYFSTFFLGDIYTLLFLMFHAVMEIMTTAVTFQCLVETIVSEWPCFKRWFVTFTIIIIAVSIKILSPMDLTLVLAYNKCTATLLECIVIYCMYPVYRLVDDIAFHTGTPVHFFRVQLLTIVPLFYGIKYFDLYQLTQSLLVFSEEMWHVVVILILSYSLMLGPLLLGMIYIVSKYILKERKNWRSLFAPAEDWGPRNYNTRQLRKGYDSRTYNGSQAPRSLSRYIIGRAESNAYRLDIRYEQNRRSTVPNYDFNIDNEK